MTCRRARSDDLRAGEGDGRLHPLGPTERRAAGAVCPTRRPPVHRPKGTDMRSPPITIRPSNRRLASPLRRGGVATLIASAVLLLSSGLAHADETNLPAHGWRFLSGVQCSNGGTFGSPEIAVNFPDVMKSWYGGTERVWFTADVYRLNGSQWSAYDTSKPWMYAWASGSGLFSDHRGYFPWHYSTVPMSAPRGSPTGTRRTATIASSFSSPGPPRPSPTPRRRTASSSCPAQRGCERG